MLRDLANACRKSGLTVVEIPGWGNRTRPGSFSPRGVLCHHTGGSSDSRTYVDWMTYTGRPDLPAPLCQLALSRTGVVYVCAAGRANHGGTAKATGPMPSGDANTLYIGIEAMNTGSEGWSDRQRDAYARLCAALCKHYGWPATHVRAHRETSVTGKWDPGLLDMDDFRADVARLINQQEGDIMPNDAKTILDRLDDIEGKIDGSRERDTARFRKLQDRLATLRKQGRATKAELDELAAVLDEA